MNEPNLTARAVKIKNPCLVPAIMADGSGVIVLHRDGRDQEFEITNAERVTLIHALRGRDALAAAAVAGGAPDYPTGFPRDKVGPYP